MKIRFSTAALLVCLACTPAWATIVVSLEPTDSIVPLTAPFTVDIVANIPQAEAVAGWGLDFEILDPSIVSNTGAVLIGPSWTTAPSLDGDNLAGLGFPDTVWGEVVLATVILMPMQEGSTNLLLSDDAQTDGTEGFALFPSGLADVEYTGGTVTVIPEPTVLTLLGLGGLLIVRRRKRFPA